MGAIANRLVEGEPDTKSVPKVFNVSDISSVEIPKPLNWQDFQRCCVPLFRNLIRDPQLQEWGREGQDQQGIDLFGFRDRNPKQNDELLGVVFAAHQETDPRVRANLPTPGKVDTARAGCGPKRATKKGG